MSGGARHSFFVRPDRDPHPTEQARWFAEEVQPHESSLRSYLRSVFPSLPDIDDLVQESYARLIRAREAGRVSDAKAFLFTTARNAALDIFRRRRVVSIHGVEDLAAFDIAEDRPDAAAAINKQQELALLAAAVRGLPERCRQVLTRRLLYAMSHKEIGAELGISEHTVKAQLAKGMRRCAEYFAERGVSTLRRPARRTHHETKQGQSSRATVRRRGHRGHRRSVARGTRRRAFPGRGRAIFTLAVGRRAARGGGRAPRTRVGGAATAARFSARGAAAPGSRFARGARGTAQARDAVPRGRGGDGARGGPRARGRGVAPGDAGGGAAEQGYATTVAGYERVTLDDGSTLELNSASEVRVRFSPEERRVRLVRGEAHFTVAKNRARPFVVEAAGVAVRAVGTAFNVRLGAREVEVLVTEGKVQVGQGGGRVDPNALSESLTDPARWGQRAPLSDTLLSANERTVIATVRADASTAAAAIAAPVVGKVDPAAVREALAWQGPRLVFADTPLAEVIAQFNRRNTVQIELADLALAALPIGGSFRAENVEGFVRLLVSGNDVAVERSDATHLVLRKTK